MEWDAIAAIGEIVGAGAVVLTLIYLARQLRQNTEALRSAAWQSTQNAEHQFDTLIVESREVMDIFVRGLRDGKAGFGDDEVGVYQWWTVAKMLLDLFQTHHYQYELGLVEEDWWQTWVSQYEETIEDCPGFREFVQAHYQHLRPAFRAFVDAHPYQGDDEATLERPSRSWPKLGEGQPVRAVEEGREGQSSS